MADSNVNFTITNYGRGVKTFISDPVASVDGPEPSEATASFKYQFFTRSEKSEFAGGSGFIAYSEISGTPISKVARYVELTFKGPRCESVVDRNRVPSLIGGRLTQFLRDGLLNIEDSVSSAKFQRLQINADGVDARIIAAVSGSSVSIVPEAVTSNPELSSRISTALTGIRGEIPQELLATAAIANSDAEIGQTIVKYINASSQPQGVEFFNNANRSIAGGRADIIAERQETLSVNRIVLDRIIRASTCNVNHLLVDEIADQRESSAKIQNDAIISSNAGGISASSYDIAVTAIDVSQSAVSSERSHLIGFLVEKIEVKANKVVQHPSIVIEGGAGQLTVYDSVINYGSYYRYRVRALYMRETIATFASTGGTGRAKILVASSGESAETSVECVETSPPPHPADVMISFDYDAPGIRVSWSPPVNTQRDIKYFQVFKRMTDTEAFRLVKVIDFDDSYERTQLSETYPSRIVSKSGVISCIYVDENFSEGSEAIYAVCSVDAHGYSSGYSTQMGATFRRSKNAVVTRLVSRSGAPKSYPNLYLNEDTFSDTVRFTGKRKITSIIDPEAIRISFGDGSVSENVLEDSTFTISLINEEFMLGDSIVLRSAKTALGSLDIYKNATSLGNPESAASLDAEDTVSGEATV